MANKYALQSFVMQLASGASALTVPGALRDSATVFVTGAPSLFAAAVTLAASTVAAPNPNPVPVSVTVSGGTVTAISISGGASVGTSGTFTIPVGGTVAVTYSVAPTLTTADIAPSAGTPNMTGVLAAYLAAYPNGPQVS